MATRFITPCAKVAGLTVWITLCGACFMGSVPPANQEPSAFSSSDLFSKIDEKENSYKFYTNNPRDNSPQGRSYWYPLQGSSSSQWSLTAQKIQGSQEAGFGMIFAYSRNKSGDTESMLTILIRTGGDYQLGKLTFNRTSRPEYISYTTKVNGDGETVAAWQKNKHIETGYQKKNTLTVERSEEEFQLSINGKLVETFTPRIKDVGMGVGLLSVLSASERLRSTPVEIIYVVDSVQVKEAL